MNLEKTLVFATHNPNKVKEISSLLNGAFRILTLDEAGIDTDIPEPHPTLEANAREKSSVIYKMTGMDSFGEDTGLEVTALNGAPGVLSARYAGEQKKAEDNIRKLLKDMEGFEDRSARFRTVISLIVNGQEHRFEGICPGVITRSPRGDQGFGYDPVFIPSGSEKTFAEMDLPEKNRFSHRTKAMSKMIEWLRG